MTGWGRCASLADSWPSGRLSGERLIVWGGRIGVACAATVRRMLERRRHPERAYRACLGLLSLAKRHGDARLEAACTTPLTLRTCKYTHIPDILANRRDRLEPSRVHGNRA